MATQTRSLLSRKAVRDFIKQKRRHITHWIIISIRKLKTSCHKTPTKKSASNKSQ